MIYQKHIFLFVCFCLLLGQIQAQDKVNFCLKAGTLSGALSVKSPNLIKSENGATLITDGNGIVAIAFNAPLYKAFRIGAEVGLASFEQFNTSFFDFGSNGEATEYLGYYQITQAYFAIVPEYRITKWAFINMGAGYYNDFNSNYRSGAVFGTNNSLDDLQGVSFKRSNPFGFFFGAGICPNITSKLAILMEARLVGSPAKEGRSYTVDMGYRALGLNFGLIYKPN